MKTVLVTGGTGYIGSHTVIQLIEAGFQPIIVDNLSNSKRIVLDRIKGITGVLPKFVEADIRDAATLSQIFEAHEIDSVIHFAGLKAVGESSEIPLQYYDNNVSGSVNLFEVMSRYHCKRLVFSSSATVYGDPASVPIKESFPTSATNPYGRTKLMIEDILRDLSLADGEWKMALLRYFNPVGAHSSGTIGEDPNGIPNNLLPYVTQVAVGKLDKLSVFGNDYSTKDGTGVRDYIHVEDLAAAHVKAVERIQQMGGAKVYNLGTGKGYSVLDMVNTFESVTGQKVPYVMAPRRPGDIAECWADASLAKEELDWHATKELPDMLCDAWRWQSNNPRGYEKQ